MLIIAFLFLMEKMTKFGPETSLWGLLARVQDNGSSDSPVMKTQLLLLHAWYNPEQNLMKGHGLQTTPGIVVQCRNSSEVSDSPPSTPGNHISHRFSMSLQPNG